MSILVKTTPAPVPRTKDTTKIATLYAGILVIFAVTQLFTFEEFIIHMQLVGAGLGTPLAYTLGPLMVVSEVFAIPFLLRMSLSTAFRWLSMFLGWLVAGLWLTISLWMVLSRSQLETVGFVGTLANLTPGLWAVFISFALVILAIWASWGLWPGKRSKK